MVFYLILSVHLGLCISLIILVLMQQGKGADAGATFAAGASSTIFGASGPTDFVTKLTTGLAIGFMVTSILLVRAYQHTDFRSSTVASSPLQGSALQGLAVEAPPVAADSEAPEASNPALGAKAETSAESGQAKAESDTGPVAGTEEKSE